MDAVSSPIELIDTQLVVNVMISEDGRRLWVCTDRDGTIFRAKVGRVTLEDRRLAK